MKEEIIQYLQDNVIHRELKTDDVIYHLENGTLEGIYSDTMIFSDLSVTDNGLEFSMTTVTTERIYKLDTDQKHAGIIKDYTGTSVFRYKLAVRKSSRQVTGYVHCLSTTVANQTMDAVVYGVYNVELSDNQLKWKEQQLFYRDSPAENGGYKAVAFDSDIRFYQEDGKLRFEYIPRFFDVDPQTMTKTLSANQYPPFISKEIGKE